MITITINCSTDPMLLCTIAHYYKYRGVKLFMNFVSSVLLKLALTVVKDVFLRCQVCEI